MVLSSRRPAGVMERTPPQSGSSKSSSRAATSSSWPGSAVIAPPRSPILSASLVAAARACAETSFSRWRVRRRVSPRDRTHAGRLLPLSLAASERTAAQVHLAPPGRLAQPGERRLDKAEVAGSSPASPMVRGLRLIAEERRDVGDRVDHRGRFDPRFAHLSLAVLAGADQDSCQPGAQRAADVGLDVVADHRRRG